ncbi:substrate-binding periplasmic protein [Novispirillum itersonii]|uniref:substrate-binding periplasmic protein n=1 Tax=Novispirillum itersonii TaxID=189 RepID=UPI0005C1E09F|nr:transporter substrate-binding domain-containing protein [Novispirillum itersonii]
MMRRIILWACLALTAAALPVPAPAGPPAPVTSPAPPPAQIVIAAEDAFPPWSLPDGRGAANAIVLAAFKRQGITVDLHTVPYARCRRAVISGEVAACLSMGATEDTRRSVLLPAIPLVQASAALVTAADDRAGSPLTGCTPAGWRGTPVIGVVNGYEYPPEWDTIARSGRAKLVTVQSETAGLRMLGAGRLDAMALMLDPLRTLEVLMRQAGQTFRATPQCPLGGLPLYVGFNPARQDAAALIRAFEDGYHQIESDGTLAAIMAEWEHWARRAARRGEHRQAGSPP